MKKSFGQLHYAALFFQKLASRTTKNPTDALNAIQLAISLLKGLDELQKNNPLVTFSLATDSLRMYYKGLLAFHIVAKKNRLVLWSPYSEDNHIRNLVIQHKVLFKPEMEPNIQWQFTGAALGWFLTLLNDLWKYERIVEDNNDTSHPRHISGEVRQEALNQFLASGRRCMGVAGLTKPHKLKEKDRIEFDHILPYALGGSNNIHNVQVLCVKCNAIKRATAL